MWYLIVLKLYELVPFLVSLLTVTIKIRVNVYCAKIVTCLSKLLFTVFSLVYNFYPENKDASYFTVN